MMIAYNMRIKFLAWENNNSYSYVFRKTVAQRRNHSSDENSFGAPSRATVESAGPEIQATLQP